MLTSTPTLRPTSTPVPSATPVPPASTATLISGITVPRLTPAALPAMGIGDMKASEPDPGSPLTRIQIPGLNLDTPVNRVRLSGGEWDTSKLGASVGWLESTSRPELGGNTVLIGHLDLKGNIPGPFATLANLTPGMSVIVFSGELAFRYRVIQRMQVDPGDMSVVNPSALPRLTLLTCDAESWDSAARRYQKLLVVVAERIALAP
jgi:LPXTG-site transpeptidase (sortase) family protein